MSTSPSTTEVTHQNFSLFPKLPLELRLHIWRSSLTPRLVTFHPHFHDAIPAAYHTSREARYESRYQFSDKRMFNIPIINCEIDILWIDNRENETALYWHGFFIPELLSRVKKVALPLEEVQLDRLMIFQHSLSIFREALEAVRGREIAEEMLGTREEAEDYLSDPLTILDCICPRLEDLIFVVRPRLACGFEDLYEVHEAEGRLQGLMDFVRWEVLEAKSKGRLKSANLRFMRCETWQR